MKYHLSKYSELPNGSGFKIFAFISSTQANNFLRKRFAVKVFSAMNNGFAKLNERTFYIFKQFPCPKCMP